MLSNAGLRFTGFEASRRGLSARRALCNNHNWRKLDVCLCPPCVMGMVGCWGREVCFGCLSLCMDGKGVGLVLKLENFGMKNVLELLKE